jgi:predicted dehydrogenase
LRIGFIGFGYIARKHAKEYCRYRKYVKLVAVCDKNPGAKEEARRILGGSFDFYTDPQAMLSEQNLDMVHISTPPLTHAPLSILCMQHGCHVAVEKPIATTVKDCEMMIQVMRDKGVKLIPLHTSLYNPAFLRLKEIISRGEIGEIFGVDINFLGRADEYFIVDPNHWSHKLPGGAFCESLPHPLYLAQQLIPRLEVEAVFWQKRGKLEHMSTDDLLVVLKGDGARITIRLGWNSPKNSAVIRVYGTKAHVDCDLFGLSVVKRGKGDISPVLVGADNLSTIFSLFKDSFSGFFKWAVGWRGGYQTLIQKIVHYLTEGGPPPVSIDDAREVVRITEEICSKIPSNK